MYTLGVDVAKNKLDVCLLLPIGSVPHEDRTNTQTALPNCAIGWVAKIPMESGSPDPGSHWVYHEAAASGF